MKKTDISKSGFMLLFSALFLFTSCSKEDNFQELNPKIETNTTDINLGYEAGSTTLDVTSNVIYYANITSGKSWLTYKFSDNARTISIVYSENPDETERSGTVELSRGDEIVTLTITQEGNPNAGAPKDIEIAFTIGKVNNGAITSLTISPEESTKIPVGSSLIFECDGEGRISGSFTGFSSVNNTIENGKVVITWSQAIADAAAAGGFTVLFFDGDFTVTRVYVPAPKLPTDISFTLPKVNNGTITSLAISAEESAKIPVGSTVTFICDGEGRIDGSFTGFASVKQTVTNGEVTFVWSADIAEAASANGFTVLFFDGDFTVTRAYYL